MKEFKIYNYIKEGFKMERTRKLTQREISELVYALALAVRKNNVHASECGIEASMANDAGAQADYAAECARYRDAAEIDAILIDQIVAGEVVILVKNGEEADGEPDGINEEADTENA